MSKIKICGIQYKEEIEFLNLLKPDYIGFVFAQSKRQVDFHQAQQLKELLDPSIQTIGVFVNHPIDTLIEMSKSGVLDVIQLHGDEDEGYIEKVKAQVGLPLMKAVGVGEKLELPKGPIDYYLLDTKSEKGYGGTGEEFNWNLLKGIDKTYFLAGGIGIDNVEEALSYKPYCIDLSSKVETNNKKDINKVKAIIEKVRKNCG